MRPVTKLLADKLFTGNGLTSIFSKKKKKKNQVSYCLNTKWLMRGLIEGKNLSDS